MNNLIKLRNKLDKCCILFDRIIDTDLEDVYKEYLKEALVLVETVAKECEDNCGKTCSSEHNRPD